MEIREFGNENTDIVLIHPVDDHDLEGIEKEYAAIVKMTNLTPRLIAAKIDDWNKELSPWEAPAVFGKEGFGSCGKDNFGQLRRMVC